VFALSDANKSVRFAAASALRRFKDGRAAEALARALRDPDIAYMAATYLPDLGDLSVEPLVRALNDQDAAVRKHAAFILGRMGDTRAVEPLIAALEDDNATAASVLGGLRHPDVVPALGRALKEGGVLGVRPAAAAALGRLGDPAGVDLLVAALDDLSSFVRRNAAEALGKLRDGRAAKPLIHNGLSDQAIDVHNAAVAALIEMGEVSVDALIAVAEGTERAVKRRFPKGLYDPGSLPDNDRFRSQAIEILGSIGDLRAVDSLIAALSTDNSPSVRLEAVLSLGRIADKCPATSLTRLATSLTALIEDPNAKIRDAALWALGSIGDARGVAALIVQLKEPSFGSWGAARILGNSRALRAVQPLIEALRRDDHTGIEAATALVKIGEPSIEGLIQLLQEDNGQSSVAQAAAAQALGRIGQPRAVPALIVALRNVSSSVRRNAAEALGRIGDMNALDERSALRDTGECVRSAAATALDCVDASNALIATLTDDSENVRTAAVNALGQIGRANAIEPLLLHAEDNNSLAGPAIAALERICLRAAHDVSSSALRLLARLDDIAIVLHCWGAEEWSAPWQELEWIDCSHVRQYARQELIRRNNPDL
jgi:HEAT repeat protein